MDLVQFSQGILAVAANVSTHVTEAQAEISPHPDNLVNPFADGASDESRATAIALAEEAEIKRATEAREAQDRLAAELAQAEADKAAQAVKDAAEADAKAAAEKAEADKAEAEAAAAKAAAAKTTKK